jgi:nucleotide-binding universal stress UspA family protein
MTMLVAVSDVRADRAVVQAAVTVAAAAGWELQAVHVRTPAEGRPVPEAAEGLDLAVVEGVAEQELLRLAVRPEVDAVALGLRTREEPGLGRVASVLLEGHRSPLLLVRPGMRPLTSLRRILVPLEGSPSASDAMLRADEAFCTRGVEIVMLHVVGGEAPHETGSFPAPRMMDQEHYEWGEWKEEFTMRFSQCPEGGRHRVAVRVGAPGPTIVDEAREMRSDLLVVSWSATLAPDRAPVLRTLLERSPCPLLLVPAAPAAEAASEVPG